jgi:predicted amidohydrolase
MTDLIQPNLHQLGTDHGNGNLLGIEPYMVQQDYVSAESFYNKLRMYLTAAQHEQWLNEKTIVVFPEYIGSWLVLAGENQRVYQASTFSAAQQTLVFHNLWKFITALITSKEKSKAEATFFRMKATQMADIYHDTFSHLAKEFGITIVAGSIILPAPHISNGQLLLSNGPLYNVSLVYQPDGEPHPKPILKAFPTSEELTFMSYMSANKIPSFDTPAGRLGVLICADSWFPQAYASLKEQGISLLAIPSYAGFSTETWSDPWNGYSGWQAPTDVNIKDVKNITEGDAWKKYALAGRIHSSGAKYGVNVFLRGKLWDQDAGGWPATLVIDGEVFVEEQTDKAAILNLWI